LFNGEEVTYSGRHYTYTYDAGKVHTKCHDEYTQATADK
jgi:hypothetical protein